MFGVSLGIRVGNSNISGGGVVLSLLDLYPSAAAAYSLRKLRTAYSGNAIRVRRSSDNAEQDIGFSSGNLDTAALTTFCGSGNGFVTTWYDQSGNSKNSIQGVAANQPQIVNGGSVILENGLPTLQFDGSNDTLLTSITYSLANITAIKLERWRSTNSGQMSANFTDFFYFQWVQNNNKISNYYSGGLSETALTTVRKLYSFYQSEGFYENNSLTVSNTASSTNSGSSLNIGSYFAGLNASVNIQEFIIYTSVQTSNRTGIESNINTYYGIY